MYTVYVLKSQKDLKLYYGFTKDLENRLSEHNTGQVKATKPRRPFVLIYSENVDTVLEARRKEKYFKSGFGRKYVQNRINMALSSIG